MKALQASDETYGFGSYSELIDSFEVEVVLEIHDDDYQGDSRYVLRSGERYGLLFFGWGSCSGCDALQACDSVSEATELRDQLWNSVHWEPTASGLLRYINEKDWELDYAWHASETRSFIEQAKTLLTSCPDCGC
jgi:hypothetical protein